MVLPSTYSIRSRKPVSALQRLSLFALVLVVTPGVAGIAIADGMELWPPASKLEVTTGNGSAAPGAGVPPLPPLAMHTSWNGSAGTPSNGGVHQPDAAGAGHPFLSTRMEPPMAAAAGEFAGSWATPALATTPAVAEGRSAPRVVFSGLALAFAFGLTVLAGVNSRKRWPAAMVARRP